ncbi:hypothetical protein K474DRAFT_1676951 [Panus rudis PR-1116 ss-1]|nr:hypothetical protein K474DRAFT_1676951 [Panus rudis PR-1116 ss-1]
MPSIIPPTCPVTHLNLKVYLVNYITSRNSLVNEIVNLVNATPLEYLMLTLVWDRSSFSATSNEPQHVHVNRCMQNRTLLATLQPIDIAQRVAEVVTSLRYCGVTIDLGGTHDDMYPEQAADPDDVFIDPYDDSDNSDDDSDNEDSYLRGQPAFAWVAQGDPQCTTAFYSIERGAYGRVTLHEKSKAEAAVLIRQALMESIDYNGWDIDSQKKFDHRGQVIVIPVDQSFPAGI